MAVGLFRCVVTRRMVKVEGKDMLDGVRKFLVPDTSYGIYLNTNLSNENMKASNK